jgi:hypothetical protein
VLSYWAARGELGGDILAAGSAPLRSNISTSATWPSGSCA